ncbi:MAG: hypothetical protein WCA79_07195 [Anaerolineales bacterium]
MADTVEPIHCIFKGQKRITRREIEEHPRMKSLTANFDVLQASYVIAATKQAFVHRRSPNDRALYFNFKS